MIAKISDDATKRCCALLQCIYRTYYRTLVVVNRNMHKQGKGTPLCKNNPKVLFWHSQMPRTLVTSYEVWERAGLFLMYVSIVNYTNNCPKRMTL